MCIFKFLYTIKNVVDFKVESYNSKTYFIGDIFLKNVYKCALIMF